MRRSFDPCVKLVLFLSALLTVPRAVVLAQEKGDEPGAKDDGKPPEVKEREKRISALFSASKVTFEKDRIVLVYEFESREQSLTEDWLPKVTLNNQRIRWPRPGESLYSTLEDGLMVGDYGEWFHSASFLGNIEVEVELLQLSPHKAGNMMAVAFYNEKKKQAIGTNAGSQAVCLASRKHSKPPIPKTERTVSANDRHRIGFVFDGKKLECRFNGKKQADTAESPKFTDGFNTGRVGLIWTGVQYFIFKVTMKGTLDPAWLAPKLGEGTAKGKDSAATKKKDAADAASKKSKPADKKESAGKKTPP